MSIIELSKRDWNYVEQRKLGCPCCSDSTSSVVVVDRGCLVLPRVAGVVAGVVGVVGVVGLLLLLLLPVFAIWHGWTDWWLVWGPGPTNTRQYHWPNYRVANTLLSGLTALEMIASMAASPRYSYYVSLHSLCFVFSSHSPRHWLSWKYLILEQNWWAESGSVIPLLSPLTNRSVHSCPALTDYLATVFWQTEVMQF